MIRLVRTSTLRAMQEEVAALRSHLMLEMEDHAKTRASNARLLDATARLVVASRHLTDSLESQTVIVPPPGGLVA